MRIIDPKEASTNDLHQYLVGAVAPRPIAFASTIDSEGNPNIAPYSFFNVFSSNPPILVFSSNRRRSNNTTKDTLSNVKATGEVVINIVSYAIVRQMAVASIEFPTEVNEFEKSGLTPLPSDLVKPYRIKESPVQFECKVQQILPLGDQGGAGHLILCEVIRIHIDEGILDERNRINPHQLDLMGRMGRAYYVRASGESIHTILQPVNKIPIGYDQLPERIKNSSVFTGNNLGQFAGLETAPDEASVKALYEDIRVANLLKEENAVEALHRLAQKELEKEDLEKAAQFAWLSTLI